MVRNCKEFYTTRILYSSFSYEIAVSYFNAAFYTSRTKYSYDLHTAVNKKNVYKTLTKNILHTILHNVPQQLFEIIKTLNTKKSIKPHTCAWKGAQQKKKVITTAAERMKEKPFYIIMIEIILRKKEEEIPLNMRGN